MDKMAKLLIFVTVMALIVDDVYPWGMSGPASNGLQRDRRSIDSKPSLMGHLTRVARSPARQNPKDKYRTLDLRKNKDKKKSGEKAPKPNKPPKDEPMEEHKEEPAPADDGE